MSEFSRTALGNYSVAYTDIAVPLHLTVPAPCMFICVTTRLIGWLWLHVVPSSTDTIINSFLKKNGMLSCALPFHMGTLRNVLSITCLFRNRPKLIDPACNGAGDLGPLCFQLLGPWLDTDRADRRQG